MISIESQNAERYAPFNAVCLRSSDPFSLVTYYIKRALLLGHTVSKMAVSAFKILKTWKVIKKSNFFYTPLLNLIEPWNADSVF